MQLTSRVHLVSENVCQKTYQLELHGGGGHERVRILAYCVVSRRSVCPGCWYLDSHLETELADGFAVVARLLQLVSIEVQGRSTGKTHRAGSWIRELDIINAEIRSMGRLVFFGWGGRARIYRCHTASSHYGQDGVSNEDKGQWLESDFNIHLNLVFCREVRIGELFSFPSNWSLNVFYSRLFPLLIPER